MFEDVAEAIANTETRGYAKTKAFAEIHEDAYAEDEVKVQHQGFR